MFSKKVLVIKQMAEGYSYGKSRACGICRLEKEHDVLTVYLSLIGFSALTSGEYRLYLAGDDKTVIKKSLGKIPSSCTLALSSEINLEKGVSAGIWALKDDIPLLVAYNKSEDSIVAVKDYGQTVINEIIAERKIREREKEFVIESKTDEPKIELHKFAEPQTSNTPPITEIYNDEAVATENYYDLTDTINQKLSKIKEFSDEYIRRESDGNDSVRAQKEQESEKSSDFYQDERDDKGSEKAPYYASVKSELDGIFERFPAETTLQKAFSDSRWAKVYYSDDKFYVVGIVKEHGKEKYICYGVPSPYKPSPPKELAGYCSFVPLSIFDLKGDGYFMMFQDAITGKCVHKK